MILPKQRKKKELKVYLYLPIKVQDLDQWNQDYNLEVITVIYLHNANQPIITSLLHNNKNLIFIKKLWIKDSLFQSIKETKLLEILKLQINLLLVFKTVRSWDRAGKQLTVESENVELKNRLMRASKDEIELIRENKDEME